MNRERVYATRPFSTLEAYNHPKEHPEPKWVLIEHGDPERVIAYVPHIEDAERLKALLVYYGDTIPRTSQA